MSEEITFMIRDDDFCFLVSVEPPVRVSRALWNSCGIAVFSMMFESSQRKLDPDGAEPASLGSEPMTFRL